MDDFSFIVTAVCIYVGIVLSIGTPNLLVACNSRWSVIFGATESPSRMQESRRESMQAWAAIVTAVSEMYFVMVSSMRVCFPHYFVRPLCQDLQMWCCFAFLAGLRWTCRPGAQMSKWEARLVTILFNVSSVLAQIDVPKEFLPACAVSRATHGLFTADPLFTIVVRIACIPLSVVVHHLRADAPGHGPDALVGCLLVIVNEGLSALCMFFTLAEVNDALCKQEQAATDLQDQIQKRETDIKETQQVLLAARRLLSVVCDCCEQLTHNWEIMRPSHRILELLQVQVEKAAETTEEPQGSMLPLLDFITLEDQGRFTDFATASHHSDAPSSLHVQMQTSKGTLFDAQIFLVNLPDSLVQHPQCLIGIATQGPPEPLYDMISIPENATLAMPSRGKTGGNTARSRSSVSCSSTSTSQKSHWDPSPNLLAGFSDIDNISFLLDLRTGVQGYCVRALQFCLKDTTAPERLPKLYQWVKRKHQPVVEDWIQEHVNAWYRGDVEPEEICRGIRCKVPGLGADFTVGEMACFGISSNEAEGLGADYSLTMKVNLRTMVLARDKA